MVSTQRAYATAWTHYSPDGPQQEIESQSTWQSDSAVRSTLLSRRLIS